MNITVFCSAFAVAGPYEEAAISLGQLIAERGHELVWGGSNVGLMKSLADSCKQYGGKVHGVSVEKLKHLVHPECDSLSIAKDLYERKRLLLDKADGVVLLPGGLGSIDEFFDALELKKHGSHNKPLVVINANGYYEHLKLLLQHMFEEGFLPDRHETFLEFVKSPREALENLES